MGIRQGITGCGRNQILALRRCLLLVGTKRTLKCTEALTLEPVLKGIQFGIIYL